MICTVLTAACSPNSLVDVQAPNTVADPSLIGTAAGAAQLRAAALIGMGAPLAGGGDANLILNSGLLTDELTEGQSIYAGLLGADERRLNDPTFGGGRLAANTYLNLHRTRARVQIALQALQLYATNVPGMPNAWQGEMYALEGYTVLWFAENFCSGIPLTAVKLVGPSVPTAGITTQDMLLRAVALFDSAIVAGADSARFVNLARVGKGRALLSLGQFAAADSAVQDVPTDFVYSATFSAADYPNQFSQYEAVTNTRVQDNEGQNGLVWSTDPRTGVVPDASNSEFLHPSKYNVTNGTLDPFNGQPIAAVHIADGLEARLIQAEAQLAAGDANWLATLNMLRRTCIGTAACAPVPGITAENLPDTLTDRGSETARQNLLFSERAMWLYLTGHREGDLRRLARVYQRDPETLWPTGTIVSPAFPGVTGAALAENGTIYGADVVFGTDPNESVTNTLYGGCYDFNP